MTAKEVLTRVAKELPTNDKDNRYCTVDEMVEAIDPKNLDFATGVELLHLTHQLKYSTGMQLMVYISILLVVAYRVGYKDATEAHTQVPKS